MSPRSKESWLSIMRLGIVTMPTTRGTQHRPTDAEDPGYHGVCLEPNVPILRLHNTANWISASINRIALL
jgi:hypothetical protein